MKSFTQFIKEEYLAVESILYHDEHLFKNICEHKYRPTEEELEKIEMELHLINEDSEKNYLQNDEEVKLIKIYQADPDSKEGREALDKLVENKMGLIYSKVKSHLTNHPEQRSYEDDLVQEGSIALIKAIESFDVNSKNIFNAYAVKCINGALLNAYNPVRQKSLVSGKQLKSGEYTSGVSLDAPVSGSRGEWADKDTTVGDSIPDPNAFQPGEGFLDDLNSNEEILATIKDWIGQLPEKEQKAIEMYFPANSEDQKTFEEIGKELKISKMGAKKMVDRVIAKIKQRVHEEFGDDLK